LSRSSVEASIARLRSRRWPAIVISMSWHGRVAWIRCFLTLDSMRLCALERGLRAITECWPHVMRPMELSKKDDVKQWLVGKHQSRLRVICATPSGKGAE
jgi:hypothetical protein